MPADVLITLAYLIGYTAIGSVAINLFTIVSRLSEILRTLKRMERSGLITAEQTTHLRIMADTARARR